MILAGLLFIRKIAATTTVAEVSDEEGSAENLILPERAIPEYVALFRVHGPLLFGSAEKVREITDRVEELPPVVILRLREMSAIDATGLSALEEAADLLHAHGRALILCGAREQPARLMRQAEFFRHVGRENLCANLSEALTRAEAVHQERLRQTMETLGEAKLSGWAD